MTKPLRLRALLARIQMLLKRYQSNNEAQQILDFGNFRLDAVSRAAIIGETEISISTNEFNLLWLLASKAGTVVGRDSLIQQLRGFGYDGLVRTIDIRVSRLRKKLNDLPSCPFEIKTIWGEGYVFVAHS